MGLRGTGLRVHERNDPDRLSGCPMCDGAPRLNSDTRDSGSLALDGHPKCRSCGCLMGPGHVEGRVGLRCGYCTANNPKRVQRLHA